MTVTASRLKEIRQEFARLKPATVTLDGNRAMTVKQAIFTLAPMLERMKKRGFDTQEIAERLHEKGIDMKPQTLTKYLTEARRQREGRKAQKRHAPAHHRASNSAIASLLLTSRSHNRPENYRSRFAMSNDTEQSSGRISYPMAVTPESTWRRQKRATGIA